jgi:predicted nucleic acid-binding protein
MAAIVDTSAWIEFFKGQGSARVRIAVTAALEEGVVVTVAPIWTELLVGLNPTRRADARAIERLRTLAMVNLDWDACEQAGMLGRTLAGRGRRIPTVDLLIAGAAAAAGHEIWHAGDQHFVWIKQIGGPPERDLSVPPR